jgi:hypothetical protein
MAITWTHVKAGHKPSFEQRPNTYDRRRTTLQCERCERQSADRNVIPEHQLICQRCWWQQRLHEVDVRDGLIQDETAGFDNWNVFADAA